MVAAKWQGQVLLEDEAQRDIVQEKIDLRQIFCILRPMVNLEPIIPCFLVWNSQMVG